MPIWIDVPVGAVGNDETEAFTPLWTDQQGQAAFLPNRAQDCIASNH